MQLLKDLERIAGIDSLIDDIISSWSGTWAQRIMQLKSDGKQTSAKSEIITSYDPENPGMCVHLYVYNMQN